MKNHRIRDFVQPKISRVFGRKPIVYLLTDEYDFSDTLVIKDAGFQMYQSDTNQNLYLLNEKEKNEYIGKKGDKQYWSEWTDESEFKGGRYYYIKGFTDKFQNDKSNQSRNITYSLIRFIDEYKYLSPELREKTLLVISGIKYSMPTELESFVEVIDVPHPLEGDIIDIIAEYRKRYYKEESVAIKELETEKGIKDIIVSMKGLSEMAIRDVLEGMWADDINFFEKNKTGRNKDFNELISEQKKQMVLKNGVISFIDYNDELVNGNIQISGVKNIETFLADNKRYFMNPEKYPGRNIPKGLLFLGVPGTGKSLLAKRIANIFGNIPLIKLNFGNLMGSLVGESEANLRLALKMAEDISPCVLFIDEIDKDLSTNGGGGNHETSKRMIAYTLSWMQDNKKQVFVYATANQGELISDAFTRSGRFNMKYFAFMPGKSQCIEILKNAFFNYENNYSKSCKQGSLFSFGWNDVEKDFSQFLDRAASNGQFFIGSDLNDLIGNIISAVDSENANFISPSIEIDDFKKALTKQLTNLSTYGKTNMPNIVDYWLKNYFHPFFPCDNELIPNNGFSIENKTSENKSYFKNTIVSNCEYDRLLIETVQKSINNKTSDDIKWKYCNN